MPAKRVVGIDLGTTHTVVAWADESSEPHLFAVPQLVAPNEVEARPLLPSSLYAVAPGETVSDPWGDAPWSVGELARRRGAEVPGRLVASAKSWLCHPGVDRTAAILPWGGDEESADVPRLSPVDAAARLLVHVRRAWDDAFPGEPLAEQDVVLTVPASFDEVARELTVHAAEQAGLRVRLLEEPQAAFYDYMHRAGRAGLDSLLAHAGGDEAFVLVCDVGGGTTDLSLLRVRSDAVERVAVGHHLLLGGDNMDLALALSCEPRLVGDQKLDPARFRQLVAACRAAKERLLDGHPPEEAPIAILGAGSKLIGGTLRTHLTREETERLVLDGFFPPAPRDVRPQRTRGALVAFGLPYERDVAITRHVAWFFERHAPPGAVPHAVLLNGGVFRSSKIAERLVATLAAWGGTPPVVLAHPEPDLGVARGAVVFGLALRGHGARIEGGAARGYYVGLDAAKGGDGSGARPLLCVVPRGAREGVPQVAAGRTLALVVGRPARFDLFVSDDARVDQPGDVVPYDEESFEPLPPMATTLGAVERRAQEIRVALEGELTAVGTLDLACVEVSPPEGATPRRFRLAFQLRGDPEPPSGAVASFDPKTLDQARDLLDRAFGKPRPDASARDVKDLLRDLEKLLGERPSWTTGLARTLFDALVPMRTARRRSADHERVFWLLAGYCVRPGFGDPGDPARIAQLAPLFVEKLAFPEGPRGWQQFWIAWRRAAGGLDPATQLAIRDTVDPFLAPSEHGLKKPKKLKPESLDDMLEMASSLERVPAARRAELGSWILERTWTDRDPRLWGAIGRLGARVPAYASVHHVVSPHTVERWLDHLLREKWDAIPAAARASVQLARMTGDRARDVGPRVREEVLRKLAASKSPEAWSQVVRELVPLEEAERAELFGEGLPVGLRLVQ